jgi:cystathionine gamma-synthase
LHPGHEIAAKHNVDVGGMLSFEVKDGRDAAMSVAAKTKIITRATSLGGVESLIEHRASIEEQEQLPLKACCDCPSVWKTPTT